MAYKAQRLRTGIFSFELPNSLAGVYPAGYAIHHRMPFMLPHTPVRYRWHVVNRNQLGDAYATQAITNLTLGMGTPLLDANGNLDANGKLTGAATQVLAPVTLAAGAVEAVSGWITNSTHTINAFKNVMLTMFLNANTSLAANGNLAYAAQAASGLTTDVLLATPATALARSSVFGVLHVWLEYEFMDNGAPIFAVIGNSRSNASNGNATDNGGVMSSWPMVVAMRERGCAMQFSAGGQWAAHFTSPGGPGGRLNVYDTCAVYPEVDYVIYQELNSSDINTDQGAGAINNLLGAVRSGKAKWPNARHIITDLGPRQEYTGDRATNTTMEFARIAAGKASHLLLGAAEQCVDVESSVSDFANPARIPFNMNADGTHGNSQWHHKMAQTMPIRRKLGT